MCFFVIWIKNIYAILQLRIEKVNKKLDVLILLSGISIPTEGYLLYDIPLVRQSVIIPAFSKES